MKKVEKDRCKVLILIIKAIILGSLLTTIELSNICWASWDSTPDTHGMLRVILETMPFRSVVLNDSQMLRTTALDNPMQIKFQIIAVKFLVSLNGIVAFSTD